MAHTTLLLRHNCRPGDSSCRMSTFVIQAFDSTTVVYSGYMTKSPPLLTEKKTLKVCVGGEGECVYECV